MGLTGDRVKGKDLAKCGLATHFVTGDKFETLKNELINSANDNTDLESCLDIVNKYSDTVYDSEKFDFPNYEQIKKSFNFEGDDSVKDLEYIMAKLEQLSLNGSENEKKWATKILGSLKRASPLSLVVTMEQLKRGLDVNSLEDAYNLEAQMVAA